MAEYPSTIGVDVAPPSARNASYGAPALVEFNDGTGYRELGGAQSVALNISTAEHEHFKTISGNKRLYASKGDIDTIEAVVGFIELDKIAVQYLHGGGDLTEITPGTDTVTRERANLVGTDWTTLAQDVISSVTTEAYPDGLIGETLPGYTDYTDEMQSPAGSAFDIAGSGAEDTYYAGWLQPCNRINIDVNTAASGAYTPSVKFWDGSTWTSVSNLVDGTSGLTQDGVLSWDMPTGWTLRSVGVKPAILTNMYIVQLDWTAGTGDVDCWSFIETHTENSDYVIDPGGGRIRRVAGGDIPSGSDVYVSYTYSTSQGSQFGIGLNLTREVELRITHDPADTAGNSWDYTFYRAKVIPGGMPEDTVEGTPLVGTMTFRILADTDDNPTNPYGICTHRGTVTPA